MLALAGCATAPPPRPATLAPLRPLPVLAPAPPPAASWLDVEVAPGRWRYERQAGETRAVFGTGTLALRCDLAARRLLLQRGGSAAAILTLTTTYGARRLAAGGGVAQIAARDPLLDQLAFSRGRFMVEAADAPRLIVPAWAEPARVIEDCRTSTNAAS